MALTNGQKKALHSAARLMGPAFTEDARRLVQWNVGGFYSAADKSATRLGFIAVMAWYEGELARTGKQLARTANYWGDELAAASEGDAMAYRLRRLAAELGWDDEHLLNFMASKKLSSGAVKNLAGASPYWLWRAINALQAMIRRSRRAGTGVTT